MIPHLKNAPRFISSVSNMFRLVWQAHPASLVGILPLTIYQAGVPLATAWITKLLFDLLAQSLTGNTIVNWPQLLRLLAAQAVLMVTGQMTTPLHSYLNTELGRELTLKIQSTILQKINSFTGIAYFENPELYDTIRLAQYGAQLGSGQTVRTLMSLVQSTATLVGFLGVLLVFNPLLVGLVIATAIPQLHAQLKFGGQRFGLAHQMSPHERKKFFYSFILSSPSAAKEVRLFDIGGFFLDKILQLYKRVHQAVRLTPKSRPQHGQNK
jgi:ATP-binding cassette subfamily B protein